MLCRHALGDIVLARPIFQHLRAWRPDAWIMGFDLYPMDTLAAKQRFAAEAIERRTLVFFEHDPVVQAGYLVEANGKRDVEGYNA